MDVSDAGAGAGFILVGRRRRGRASFADNIRTLLFLSFLLIGDELASCSSTYSDIEEPSLGW